MNAPDDDDENWDEFLLMDSNRCLKLVLYSNSSVILFQYLHV